MCKSKSRGLQALSYINTLYKLGFITLDQKDEFSMLTQKGMGGNDRMWPVITRKLNLIENDSTCRQKADLISEFRASME